MRSWQQRQFWVEKKMKFPNETPTGMLASRAEMKRIFHDLEEPKNRAPIPFSSHPSPIPFQYEFLLQQFYFALLKLGCVGDVILCKVFVYFVHQQFHEPSVIICVLDTVNKKSVRCEYLYYCFGLRQTQGARPGD